MGICKMDLFFIVNLYIVDSNFNSRLESLKMKQLLGILFVGILLVGCNTTNEEQQKDTNEGNVKKDKEIKSNKCF